MLVQAILAQPARSRFIESYVCVCVLYMEYMHMSLGAHGDQKRALYPLELELQTVTQVTQLELGTELRSCVRAKGS